MGTATGSGAIAGVVGCAVFLALHAAWIVPIWFVAPIGFAIAATCGAALGELLGRVAPGHTGLPGGVVLASGLTWLFLALPAVLAELGLRPGAAPDLAIIAGFFAPFLAGGGLVGWAAGRSRGTAGRGALAGLLLAIGPGHNIPFLAGTPAVPTEVAILVVVVAAAATTFAVLESTRHRVGPAGVPQSAAEPTR